MIQFILEVNELEMLLDTVMAEMYADCPAPPDRRPIMEMATEILEAAIDVDGTINDMSEEILLAAYVAKVALQRQLRRHLNTVYRPVGYRIIDRYGSIIILCTRKQHDHQLQRHREDLQLRGLPRRTVGVKLPKR